MKAKLPYTEVIKKEKKKHVCKDKASPKPLILIFFLWMPLTFLTLLFLGFGRTSLTALRLFLLTETLLPHL